jgi:heme-degrading monooxygenase HmoA
MITEVIRYEVPAEQAQAFVRAYENAEPFMRNSKHCLGYRLLHGIEAPNHWIPLIYWDSVEGHEQGFRKESAFGQFFALVRPFLNQVQEMKHYQETSTVWNRAA